MRGILILLLLAACTKPPEPPPRAPPSPFGASYDECVLRYATSAGDVMAREQATGVCERQFARDSTQAETNVLEGQVAIHGSSTVSYITVDAQNNSDDLLITTVGATVIFRAGPEAADLSWPGAPEARFWTFAVHLEPHERTSLVGSLPPDDQLKPYFSYRSIYPERVVPLHPETAR